METKILTKSFLKRNINISKKEKRLLIILLFVVFLWIINKFTITVQSAKISELEQEKASCETELHEINSILGKDKLITDKWNEVNKNIKYTRAKYFSNIDQPKIMHLLSEIIDSNKLYIPSMNFSGPDIATINEIETKYLEISIPFEGSYNDLGSFFSQIRNSPKKFLVTQLTLSKKNDNLLIGQIGLNTYSYDEVIEGYTDYTYKPYARSITKENPFMSFEGYKENTEEKTDTVYGNEGNPISNYSSNRIVLEDFENNNVYFMTSSSNVTGKVSLFNSSKYGKHSLRTEYFISTGNIEERAYIALDDKDIVLKYPPSSLGVWVHSYAYSPATIGLRFKDQEGNKIDLELVRGVNWKDWEYIESMPPQDINIYPLKLDRLYLQLGANRDDYGVILFDNLEALYPTIDKEDKENTSYIFYVVQYGDTLESISEKMYGSNIKSKAIMNQNGLSDSTLEAGQILVIPK